jgi:SAM-dependent methyltransferase
MEQAAFIRYLEAKRVIDDRSLNSLVWEAMVRSQTGRAPGVVELGGGIGTMVERVAEEGRLRPSSWTLVDSQDGLVQEARRRLAGRTGFPVSFVPADAERFCSTTMERFDLVVAHAFLDLFDPPRLLPLIRRLAVPHGRFLFTITFDGLTAWEPEIDVELDSQIVSLYHRTMDERRIDGRPSGDSRTGRHLLTLLPRAGYRIEEAGSSDWIVFPRDGGYLTEERVLLSSLLGYFEESLSGRTELDPRDLARWLDIRRGQLAAGTLVFLAHQLDVLAAPDQGVTTER